MLKEYETDWLSYTVFFSRQCYFIINLKLLKDARFGLKIGSRCVIWYVVASAACICMIWSWWGSVTTVLYGVCCRAIGEMHSPPNIQLKCAYICRWMPCRLHFSFSPYDIYMNMIICINSNAPQ